MPVTNLPYDRRLNGRAKELRHEMTPQETKALVCVSAGLPY